MERDDIWSAKWTCEKLLDGCTRVTNALPVSHNLIKIQVGENTDFVKVATMSINFVDGANLRDVYTDKDIEFALNIKKDAFVTGEAIDFAKLKSFGLGCGLGDLYIAVDEKNFRDYLPKETKFILRGLEQHTKVQSVDRLNNRLYRILRKEKRPLTVLALNEYDLTADSVRTGIETFGKCDIILTSNPNCQPTRESKKTAECCGVRLLNWGELMGVIHH